MIKTITISAIGLIGLILLIFFKPAVLYKRRSINIYWLAPLCAAAVLILTGSIGVKETFESLTRDSGVNPIKILVLLLSMTIISIYLDNAGFFSHIAMKIVAIAGSGTKQLFLLLYLIVSFLTFFTSNDIIVLTFTPFICYFARSAKIDPVPFLVCEFVAANTWSMALMIGNPTNIYLASNAGIVFLDYLKIMLLPTLASGIVSYAVMRLVFKKALDQRIEQQNIETKLKNRFDVFIALIHLTACIFLMSISSYIDLPMWLIALFACVSLIVITSAYSLIRKRGFSLLKATIARAPWDVIPFVVSMFIIVFAFEKSGIIKHIANALSCGAPVYSFGLASFFSANVINNIPMSVLFSSVCEKVSAFQHIPALYASVIGSNIGAFLTPIGAIAGIMWMSLLKIQRVRFGYADFIKYGAIVSIPTIITALTVLQIVL